MLAAEPLALNTQLPTDEAVACHLDAARKAQRKSREASWRNWAQAAVAGGAGGAHAWTKEPEGMALPTALTCTGTITALPSQLINSEGQRLAGLWAAKKAAPPLTVPLPPLP